MQTSCTAKESYPGGPKVCRIADLPYFEICIGEAFLQRGQALQQRLRLFFFFYPVIAGKVQVELVSGDGERRQKAVSLFIAMRGTAWVMSSGNTSRVSNGTGEPAAIAFTRVHGSVRRLRLRPVCRYYPRPAKAPIHSVSVIHSSFAHQSRCAPRWMPA
jgi:hypothetical protein